MRRTCGAEIYRNKLKTHTLVLQNSVVNGEHNMHHERVVQEFTAYSGSGHAKGKQSCFVSVAGVVGQVLEKYLSTCQKVGVKGIK